MAKRLADVSALPIAKWWPSYTASKTHSESMAVGQEHLFLEHEHRPVCGKQTVRAEVAANGRCRKCRTLAVSGKYAVAERLPL